MILRNDLYDQIMEKFKAVGMADEPVKLFNIRDELNQNKDVWNDYLGFCIDGQVYLAKGTTDPGINAIKRHPEGPAHLSLGLQKNIWVIDVHAQDNPKFAHGALCSRKSRGCSPTKYYRDQDKNFVRSTDESAIDGFIGINMHRASKIKDVSQIGDYSDGCQVRLNVTDHEQMMELIKSVPEVAATRYENKGKEYFSYLFSLLLTLKSEWVGL